MKLGSVARNLFELAGIESKKPAADWLRAR